jgi:hypothetical protein
MLNIFKVQNKKNPDYFGIYIAEQTKKKNASNEINQVSTLS